MHFAAEGFARQPFISQKLHVARLRKAGIREERRSRMFLEQIGIAPPSPAKPSGAAPTREAIEALVEALKRPKEAVPAAVALLNRGWERLPKLSSPIPATLRSPCCIWSLQSW